MKMAKKIPTSRGSVSQINANTTLQISKKFIQSGKMQPNAGSIFLIGINLTST